MAYTIIEAPNREGDQRFTRAMSEKDDDDRHEEPTASPPHETLSTKPLGRARSTELDQAEFLVLGSIAIRMDRAAKAENMPAIRGQASLSRPSLGETEKGMIRRVVEGLPMRDDREAET
ncbi:hypothetical protein F1880_004926 [Penicillium rolfsii]|nr:hypothetical protein F1880_004926 [Penicillium rolfsii]